MYVRHHAEPRPALTPRISHISLIGSCHMLALHHPVSQPGRSSPTSETAIQRFQPYSQKYNRDGSHNGPTRSFVLTSKVRHVVGLPTSEHVPACLIRIPIRLPPFARVVHLLSSSTCILLLLSLTISGTAKRWDGSRRLASRRPVQFDPDMLRPRFLDHNLQLSTMFLRLRSHSLPPSCGLRQDLDRS